MSELPNLFADTVQEANVVHGVARLRLAQVISGGRLAPAGTLVVPVSQLQSFASALTALVQQLDVRAQNAALAEPGTDTF